MTGPGAKRSTTGDKKTNRINRVLYLVPKPHMCKSKVEVVPVKMSEGSREVKDQLMLHEI